MGTVDGNITNFRAFAGHFPKPFSFFLSHRRYLFTLFVNDSHAHSSRRALRSSPHHPTRTTPVASMLPSALTAAATLALFSGVARARIRAHPSIITARHGPWATPTARSGASTATRISRPGARTPAGVKCPRRVTPAFRGLRCARFRRSTPCSALSWVPGVPSIPPQTRKPWYSAH